MWKVYCPAWVNAALHPYEATSVTYKSLVSEMEYIGMFFGGAHGQVTLAVYDNPDFDKRKQA